MNEKDEKDEKNDVDLASFNTARKVNENTGVCIKKWNT